MLTTDQLSDLQKDAYQCTGKKVLETLHSKPEKGLSTEEVKKRQEKFGKNQLEERDRKSILSIILAQLNNPVIYLLAAAAILAFLFGDIPEAIVIIVVLIANTIIGFWMEFQAQKSMEAIKKLDKTESRVLRDGKEVQIDAQEIVPGDILIINAGDLVPADARIIQANELKVDESPLTGESVPVDKNEETLNEEKQVADRTNILHKGTAVTGGTAKAVVFATAMHTEVGNISAMVQDQENDETPLTAKLNKLTKNLIWVILAMAAAFFIFGWLTGKDLYQLVQTSIAWAIAAIPEGLPIVASIALARGMLRLSKKNVLVKKLSAVETLGETTVIFTDKTGTLTENNLTVQYFAFPGDIESKIQIKENKPQLEKQKELSENSNFEQIAKISLMANDAEIDDDGMSNGDPLEIALLQFYREYDRDVFKKTRNKERVAHKPFDSDSMLMGVAYKDSDKVYIAAKGSTDAILKKSTQILERGEVKDLNKKTREKWQKRNDDLSDDGLRVLAFGYATIANAPKEENNFIEDLCFIGLIGFIDPPRKEIKDSIEICRNAGIKVVMVTGDHPGTAKNVGKTVHLYTEEDEKKGGVVVHGKEIGEDQLNFKKIKNAHIFSRVDPGQKLQLIEAYQKNGEIVGMTGDGVNDAPALKKADIGIAMGKRGTQVAQEVADVVLREDTFQSIVKAIEQGRVIFDNIRRFVVYQLSYHFSEILIIALMSFTLFVLPILPLQLLFLNLLSDVFPALALGVGEGDKKILDNPPKDPEEPILTRKNWRQIISYGIIITLSVSGAYLYSHYVWEQSEEVNNTIAFFSLAFAQFLHVFNLRDGKENIINNQITRNKFIWMALALCFAVVLIAYFVPTLAEVFSFVSLNTKSWVIIGISSLMPLIIIQLIKTVKKDF